MTREQRDAQVNALMKLSEYGITKGFTDADFRCAILTAGIALLSSSHRIEELLEAQRASVMSYGT
jgi:hypothetical protein